MQLSNKQKYPARTFVENERRSKEKQWAMGMLKMFLKFKNFSSIFDKIWPGKYF